MTLFFRPATQSMTGLLISIIMMFLNACASLKNENAGKKAENLSTGKEAPRLPQLAKLAQEGFPGDSERYEAFLVAERLTNQKEFGTAEVFYQAIFEQTPSLVVGLKLARVLSYLGKNAEAENVIRKTHLLFPHDPQPMLAEAFLAQIRGSAQESLQLYKKAYAEHEDNEEVAARYAEALLVADQKKEAEEILKKSISKIPDSPYFLLKLARIRFQQKEYTQAKTLLDSLLRVDPDNVEGWTLAGFIALEEKKDEDAESYFRAAYEKQPENDTLAKYYVSQLLKLNKLQEAMRLLLRIEQGESEQSPVDTDLMFQLAVVLFQLEDFDNAKVRFLKLAASAEDPGRMYYFAGQCDESTKKFDKAIELYVQVSPDSEFYLPALQRRMIAHFELGRPDQTKELLQEYERTSKKDGAYFRFYASILSRLKEYKLALETVRKAPEKERKSPELRYLEAVYLEYVENKEASLVALEKLIKDFPLFSPALNHLGYTLVEMETRLDFATELLERAVEQEPKNGFFLDSLGWCYFKKNQLDEAEEHLLQALELEPGEPVILEHLGEVKLKQERFDMALRYFEQAMKLFEDAPSWKVESDEEWISSRKRVKKRLDELSEMALPKKTSQSNFTENFKI